ncbi:MAG: bifunctional diaminohydroxyphosphoribosylaminopyrimidine deaminase/5-amino-6-(5-phosphoribosylamino)uracil reductase RibD [Gemmobacter sp.]
MTDEDHMAHALVLAARGLGRTWPNPAVGCVIVQGGRVVGRGWTQPGGRPHAERDALDQAGPLARGATAYVTLEPCAHHGHTPPCAEALIAAGIARVVSATTDPDPRVAGRGHALLRAAGITVTEGVLEPQARRLNAGFFHRVKQGRPLVTLKLAMSLDGRIANAKGESRWITGPPARRAVHAMRAAHDAVMIGIGTALADDPDLTVRDLGVTHQPLRIVLDTHLRLPATSRLARTARDLPVWVCHGPEADPAAGDHLTDLGLRLIPCTATADRIDLPDALRHLGTAGLTRVFCEGGGTLAAALIAADLADRLVAFQAGHIFGATGTPAIGPRDAAPLGLPDFMLDAIDRIGADSVAHWSRRRGPYRLP